MKLCQGRIGKPISCESSGAKNLDVAKKNLEWFARDSKANTKKFILKIY